MTERWLSIKEVSQRINRSSQTVTDYCNEGKFPRANKPGGGKWVIPEGDVEAFLTGKPTIPLLAPAETPQRVKEANENAEIAEAEKKAILAQKEAEAAKAGFATAEAWDKAQKEFRESVEKTRLELESEKLQISEQKRKYDEGVLANSELQSQLKEQLKLANEKIIEQENINIQAKKDAEANIVRILKHFKGGTVGILEKAVYNMTTPIVTRAFLQYRCLDCHKDGSDKINRVATFEIPRLKDCPPNFAFGICGDCDPDQRDNRNLPYYVCDICPVDKMMKQSAQLVIEALATVGVKADFDPDGQYKPTTYIDDKKRHLTKDEQVRLLMLGYGIGENNNKKSEIKIEKGDEVE